MNPFIKCALTFLILFVATTGAMFVYQTFIQHVPFVLDIAWVMGISAGFSILLLVRDLTSED